MRRKLIPASLLFIGTLAFGLSACNKDDDSDPQLSIKTLFDGLRSTPQTFTVTAGSAQTITGAKGTKITFDPQSFKNEAGNTITSGTINIELTELYKPGEMIANRVTTSTVANMPLTSGGSVLIKATMSGKEVFANQYTIAFKQDAYSENDMALFKGNVVNDNTGTKVNWNDDATNLVERTVKDDVTQNNYYLFDSCTSFNWINCDYFYNAPSPKTDITVVAPDNSYSLFNTQVFVVFPAINSVVTMYGYNNSTHSFSFGAASYYLPIGTQVDIVIIGSKDGDYYMDVHQNVTVSNNLTVTFTPVNQSLENIKSMLNSL